MPTKRTTKSRTTKKAAAPKRAMVAKRADLGAPIDSFFAKQPAALKPIVLELRKIIEAALPDAVSSIKWGMPHFQVGGKMTVAIGAHKAHVNLIVAGPADAFEDPDHRLEGEGKTGRHLKLRSLAELPRDQVRDWVKTAGKLARGG